MSEETLLIVVGNRGAPIKKRLQGDLVQEIIDEYGPEMKHKEGFISQDRYYENIQTLRDQYEIQNPGHKLPVYTGLFFYSKSEQTTKIFQDFDPDDEKNFLEEFFVQAYDEDLEQFDENELLFPFNSPLSEAILEMPERVNSWSTAV